MFLLKKKKMFNLIDSKIFTVVSFTILVSSSCGVPLLKNHLKLTTFFEISSS